MEETKLELPRNYLPFFKDELKDRLRLMLKGASPFEKVTKDFETDERYDAFSDKWLTILYEVIDRLKVIPPKNREIPQRWWTSEELWHKVYEGDFSDLESSLKELKDFLEVYTKDEEKLVKKLKRLMKRIITKH